MYKFKRIYIKFLDISFNTYGDEGLALLCENITKIPLLEIMNLSHSEQIKLMIVNNSAHKLYLSNKLKYSEIIKYIMSEIYKDRTFSNLNSIKSILKFISFYNNLYKTNV